MTTFIIITTIVFISFALIGIIERKTKANIDLKWKIAIIAATSIFSNRLTLFNLIPYNEGVLYSKAFVSVIATIFMLIGATLINHYFAKRTQLMYFIGGLFGVFFYYAWCINAIS